MLEISSSQSFVIPEWSLLRAVKCPLPHTAFNIHLQMHYKVLPSSSLCSISLLSFFQKKGQQLKEILTGHFNSKRKYRRSLTILFKQNNEYFLSTSSSTQREDTSQSRSTSPRLLDFKRKRKKIWIMLQEKKKRICTTLRKLTLPLEK